MVMRTFLLIAVLSVVLSTSGASLPAAFGNWPEGADPKVVGNRVVAQLLTTEPEQYVVKGCDGDKYGGGKYVSYPVTSLWMNSLEFARLTGDQGLLRRLTDLFEPFYPGGAKADKVTKPRHVDFNVFGAVPLEIAILTGDSRARQMGLRYADDQWEPPRDGDFDLLPHWIKPRAIPVEKQLEYFRNGYTIQTRLWIDDMYMINVLQTQAYRLTGDMKYVRRAAKEMVLYLDKLQLENGLFNHAADVPFRWARGNGWMAAGMPMILQYLKPGDEHYDRILRDYRRMMKTLLAFQRENGLWGQLVDDPKSWDETSGSLMFAYGFIMGCRHGWLDADVFAPAARKAYLTVVSRLDEYGNVPDVCIGTGAWNDLQYYYDRRRINGDPHGQAPLMWCINQFLDWKSEPLPDARVATSVGDVRLSCPKPEGWTFRMASRSDGTGVDVVTVTMARESAAPPPEFSVRWFAPQTDVHHLWTSASTHYGIPWSEPMASELSSSMPLYAFLDANDRNRFTFACSESCRKVVFRSPVSETKMGFSCSFGFFAVPEAPLDRYEVEIRLDTRPLFYAETIGSAADWMCRASGAEPLAAPDCAFDALYSTWYDFHQDVSAAAVERECALAARLGMKTVIVDDGWQIDLPLGNRPWSGYRLCGDWEPGRHFPDMAAHVRRMQEMGFKYMMWYAVPFVGKDSRNFDRFKGKYLPVECAGGHVLDPRFPEVREFIVRTYEDAVRNWNIDGLKLDFIGRFALKEGVVDPAVAENYAGRDIKAIPLAVEALLAEVVKRLKALKPDILIEFRQPYVGPSIRRFGNMLRATDCPLSMVENRTRIARLRLTSGKTAVHSDMLEWRNDETAESAARCILNSLFGVVQYSVRLDAIPESHRRMLAHWIGFAEAHREALVKGAFRPHHPASDYPLLEGESATERIFGVYQKNLAVDVGSADRPVVVVNGANVDRLLLVLPATPEKVEAFDTFGNRVTGPALKAGVNGAQVPVSGYLKITWKAGEGKTDLVLK